MPVTKPDGHVSKVVANEYIIFSDLDDKVVNVKGSVMSISVTSLSTKITQFAVRLTKTNAL